MENPTISLARKVIAVTDLSQILSCSLIGISLQINIEPFLPRAHENNLIEKLVAALNGPSDVFHKQAVPTTVRPIPARGAACTGTVSGVPVPGREEQWVS